MLLERRYRMGKRNVDRLRYISHNECGRGILMAFKRRCPDDNSRCLNHKI